MSRPPRNFFDKPPEPELPPADQSASVPDTPREGRTTPRPLYRWFEKFGISEGTVTQFGCYVVEHAFPAAGKGLPAGTFQAIAIPHRQAGVEINRKLRPPKGKPEVLADPSVPMAFNIDGIETPDLVWVTESELETMAMVDAGYGQTIAIIDGQGSGNGKEKRFPALETHAEFLNTVRRFVLCASRTEYGLAWREELAARLGRHRCMIVDWPPDALRPTDLLASPGGSDALQAAINAAEPYPIEGLQRFNHDVLAELRKTPPPAVLTTGTQATDEIGLRFPTEGRLVVVTGVPMSGKSVWLRYVMVHLMRQHSRRFAVFSPEMAPWQEFVAECATVLTGKQFWRRKGFPPDQIMSDGELSEAGRWLGARLTMLTADALGKTPDLDWAVEKFALAVLRDGVTDCVIDPWNNLKHDFGHQTEATYVNDALLKCLGFCHRHGVNLWIVVHPRTQSPPKPGGKLLAPGAYEINGGAAWANHTDIGITVHRPEKATEIHVWKAKRRRWGEWRTKAFLRYSRDTGRFDVDPDAPPHQNEWDV